jgi:hypothetical protein
MAKKKWIPEWEVMQRIPIGLYMSVDGRYEYAHVVYEVTERNLKDKKIWRTTKESGEPIYIHDRPDLFEIFHMTSLGYGRLMYEGKKLDEKRLTSSKD